ncbi:MAG: 3-deoxy-8-phosphooctulonate synthase, partial [bacterium]
MILIAGPCIIESEDILKDTVEKLLEAIEDKNIDFYFKSSFKKDNRTSLDGFRGLPVREALGYLQNIKKEYNVKICTDFHTIGQIDLVKEFDVDIIQIPAFLAKQNSLLEYAKHIAKEENKILFIKKPQFIGPDDANNII